MTRIINSSLFIIFFILFAVNVQAQNDDGIKITEAKIAIDKYKDYKSALKALAGVSHTGQKNPLFIYYSAVANENAGNMEQAVEYYKKYLQIFPNKMEIIEKVAELNYKSNLVNDLSGIWDRGEFKLEQIGNLIYLTFETPGQNEIKAGRKKGDIKFRGTRTGNSLEGTFTKPWEEPNHEFNDPYECVNKIVNLDCTGTISNDGRSITFVYPDFKVEPYTHISGCKTIILKTKSSFTIYKN